jgi:hypothetical protein
VAGLPVAALALGELAQPGFVLGLVSSALTAIACARTSARPPARTSARAPVAVLDRTSPG